MNGWGKPLALLIPLFLLLAGWIYAHQTNQEIHPLGAMSRVEASARFNDIQHQIETLDREFREFRIDQNETNEKILDKLEEISR